MYKANYLLYLCLMATQRLKMDNDSLVNSFFNDIRLLGLVAPIPDYRLCWHLNQGLSFDFRVNNDIEIKLIKKGRDYFFPIYQCSENNGSIWHYLYNNQCEGEYLLPEFKHLDYLWLIRDDEVNEEHFAGLLSSIRTIPSIQLINELGVEKIKNKQHLIF